MKTMSAHAIWRAAQRNISPDDIQYILQHGSRMHRAGACFYCLGEKDIPKRDKSEDAFARLEGTVVVLDSEQREIVTVYRNREKGFKRIRKKSEYGSTDGMGTFQRV